MIASDILLDLYSCPTDPERWRPTLDGVCNEIGVASAVVQLFRRSGNSIEQTWTARDSTSTRNAEIHDRLVNNAANPRLDPAIVQAASNNAVTRDSDRFRPGCPHWAALRTRLREAGLGDSIGVGAQLEGGESLAIVLHRRDGDCRPFSQDNEQFLLQLLPHIEKAVSLSHRLAIQARPTQRIEQIATGLHVGIVTLDGHRKVGWANDAAEAILRRSPHLHAQGGFLRAAVRGQNHDLEALVARAAAASPDAHLQSVVLGAGCEDELHIVIVPQASQFDDIALMMSEPRRPIRAPVDDIARLLSVTRAEARVAAALCAGDTLKEYAQRRGISEGSARNQLKQVLAKTGTRRQSELIRHLCNSVIIQAGNQRRNRVT